MDRRNHPQNEPVILPMKRLNAILPLIFEEIKFVQEKNREQPISWNIKHLYSCSQLAKLIARERGLNEELAGIIGAVHESIFCTIFTWVR